MSYNNRLYGEITIDPPLRWSEFRDSRYSDLWNERSGAHPSDLVLRIDKVTEDTDDGTVTRKSAGAIEGRDNTGNFYHLKDELAEIAQAFAAPGRTFTGWLVIQPDPGFGDVNLTRYGIKTLDSGALDRVVTETSRVVWPDGTEAAV